MINLVEILTVEEPDRTFLLVTRAAHDNQEVVVEREGGQYVALGNLNQVLGLGLLEYEPTIFDFAHVPTQLDIANGDYLNEITLSDSKGATDRHDLYIKVDCTPP